MNRKKNLIILNNLIYWIEIMVSIFIIIGIFLSFPDIFKYFRAIVNSDITSNYDTFKNFLSFMLILVVGLEFVLMMVAHSDNSIIYLITFVIARKMLIYSDNTTDILLGVASILVLFFIKTKLAGVNAGLQKGALSAITTIEHINQSFNYSIIPQGHETIGGLVFTLMEEKGLKIETGAIVQDDSYIYQVVEANQGVISSVSIIEK